MKPLDGDHFATSPDDPDLGITGNPADPYGESGQAMIGDPRGGYIELRAKVGLGPYPDPSSPDPQERSDAYHYRRDTHVSDAALDPAFVPPPIAPEGPSGWGTDPFQVMARVVNHFHRQARRNGNAEVRRREYQARARARAARHTPIDPVDRIAFLPTDPFFHWVRDHYTGIPARTYDDEDRAQEARRGARAMRERGWLRIMGMTDPYLYPVMTAAVRAFVPRTFARWIDEAFPRRRVDR